MSLLEDVEEASEALDYLQDRIVEDSEGDFAGFAVDAIPSRMEKYREEVSKLHEVLDKDYNI